MKVCFVERKNFFLDSDRQTKVQTEQDFCFAQGKSLGKRPSLRKRFSRPQEKIMMLFGRMISNVTVSSPRIL